MEEKSTCIFLLLRLLYVYRSSSNKGNFLKIYPLGRLSEFYLVTKYVVLRLSYKFPIDCKEESLMVPYHLIGFPLSATLFFKK